MSTGTNFGVPSWRDELPALSGRSIYLRELVTSDIAPLLDLLSIGDASRFGLDLPITEDAILGFIDRCQRERKAGIAFTYAVVATATKHITGLFHVRQLDPGFEGAEWDFMLAPSARGTGAFLEAARLVGSFAFGTLGTHRIETRVLLQNGRANGALRKLGAVQEGILRRAIRRGDEYLDQVLWSVLKDDWGDRWVTTSPQVH